MANATTGVISDKISGSRQGLFAGFSYTQIVFAVLAVIATSLALEQVMYRRKKAGLPGAPWTIPVIGKFADSLRPSLEKYQEGWNSGALSVASVFHIFIVIASSTEFTRKILNSPSFTEPCLVASAKKVLCHDNWVFLNGKEHVDYRKGLNTLFTSRALSIYLSIQEGIYRRHFAKWVKEQGNSAKEYICLLYTSPSPRDRG